MTFREDENGFENVAYGLDYEGFLKWIEKKRKRSEGKELLEGFVPDTRKLERRTGGEFYGRL